MLTLVSSAKADHYPRLAVPPPSPVREARGGREFDVVHYNLSGDLGLFDRVIGSLDQSLSEDDFFEADMDDTADDYSKDDKVSGGQWGHNGPQQSVECEVIELALQSPSSTEGGDDVEVY